MKIFLSGGTGFVGGHVRQALVEKGHEIRLLVHKRGGSFGAGVEPVEGDITVPATFAGRSGGVTRSSTWWGLSASFPAAR